MEYINKYKKEHYKQIAFCLKEKEYKKYKKLLKKLNLSNREFILKIIEGVENHEINL